MKFIAVVLSLVLAGCGSSDDAATEAEDRETVFDPMIETLEKAEAVEDLVMQQKKDMDAALDRMEGETDDTPQ
jgi:hypothetical protein